MTNVVEMIAPTAERIAQAGGLMEEPEINQERARRAWRLVPLVEALHRADKISDECLKAWVRFDRDWAIATRTSSGVAKYGALSGSANDEDETELRKIGAHRRIEAAKRSIGSPHGRRALAMAVVSKQDTSLPYTMEDIGRACSRCRDRAQAVAAGTVILRDALYQLHLHYEDG